MKKLLLSKNRLALLVALSLGFGSVAAPLAQAGEERQKAVASGEVLPEPGEAQATAAEPVQSEGEGEEVPVLDSSREGVRGATEWVARGVDSWFGDIPFEEGGKVTNGRIRSRVIWRENDEVDFNLRFRVSMRLPNLQDKVYLLIGSENEEDLIRDTPDTVMDQQRLLRENRRDDETFFTGIGLRVVDNVSASIGLRDLHKPYLKLRYRYKWLVTPRNLISFKETGFWALSDGFGATTSLDFEHAFSQVLSARWHNSGTFSEEDDGLDWYTSVGLFRDFGDQKELSGEVLADGETGKDVDVEEYGVLMKWRQPVYRDWLLGELSAGHYWEREHIEDERQSKWALGVGLQMNF